MAVLFHLTDFESGSDAEQPRSAPVEALPGFAEGFDAGHRAATEAQTQINADFVQNIEAIAFGFAEAQQATLRALSPLMQALAEKLIPQIGADVLRAHIVSEICAAAAKDISAPLSLCVNPAQVEPVERILSGLAIAPVSVLPDPSLDPETARLSDAVSETALDVAGLLDAIKTHLTDFGILANEEAQHG